MRTNTTIKLTDEEKQRKLEELLNIENTQPAYKITLLNCTIQDIINHKQYEKVIVPFYNWVNNLLGADEGTRQLLCQITIVNNTLIINTEALGSLEISGSLRNIKLERLSSIYRIYLEDIKSIYNINEILSDLIFKLINDGLCTKSNNLEIIEKMILSRLNAIVEYIKYHKGLTIHTEDFVYKKFDGILNLRYVFEEHLELLGLPLDESDITLGEINKLSHEINDKLSRSIYTDLEKNISEFIKLTEYAINFLENQRQKLKDRIQNIKHKT